MPSTEGEACPDAAVLEKLASLKRLLGGFDRIVVAFSGGVDSAFLLFVAKTSVPREAADARVLAVTARSASLMDAELEEARTLAAEFGVRHEIVDTHELSVPGYVENSPDRCYFCKTELFDATAAIASKGEGVVVDGFNADDFRDHRPGHRAAEEHGVRHPLFEVGLGKDEIRVLSKWLGIRTWNKPQLACLASRLPYGMSVTEPILRRIEAVEMTLRRRGFFDVRARLVQGHEDFLRVEVGESEIARAVEPEHRHALVEAAHAVGFRFVTLDLEGFRSGRMNEDRLVLLPSSVPRTRR